MTDVKKLLLKMDKIEKMLIDIQTKLNIIVPDKKDTRSDVIKINFIKDRKEDEIVFFETYNQEKIRKYFSAYSVFECFSKGNKNLYGGYYLDGISNKKHVVLSDNKEQLEKNILELGMSE